MPPPSAACCGHLCRWACTGGGGEEALPGGRAGVQPRCPTFHRERPAPAPGRQAPWVSWVPTAGPPRCCLKPGAWRPSSGLFSAWLCCAAWEDTGVSLFLEEMEWSSSWSWLPDSGSFPLGSPVLSLGLCSEMGAAPLRVLQPPSRAGPQAEGADFHSHTHMRALCLEGLPSPHVGRGAPRGEALGVLSTSRPAGTCKCLGLPGCLRNE